MNKIKIFTLTAILLLIPLGLASIDPGEQTISLYDLGLLQLAAHDLFNVDRDQEIDFENGKLDLSTLLDHGFNNIILGGEPRNRENIILFSVSHKYGQLYHDFLNKGYTEENARIKLIQLYHKELGVAFENAFGYPMPEPKQGTATMTENLALRTIHDYLPGTIEHNGQTFTTLDFALHGQLLSYNDLQQQSGPLDGEFDQIFRNVTVFIPPNIVFTIDLFERDSSFAQQFNTTHTFEYFMSELYDNEYNDNEIVFYFINELFAKGLYPKKDYTHTERQPSYPQDNNPENLLRVAQLSYNEQATPGEQFQLLVNVENIGPHDLDDTRATLIIPELGIRSKATKIDLEENNEHTIPLYLDIPQYTQPGYYTMKIVIDLDGVRRIKHRDIEIL